QECQRQEERSEQENRWWNSKQRRGRRQARPTPFRRFRSRACHLFLPPNFALPAFGPTAALGSDLELVRKDQLVELFCTGDLRRLEVFRKVEIGPGRAYVVGQGPGLLLG